jgi:hypothetical protein
MKKFNVKSGFIAKKDENDKKGSFVERSSIEVEAESIKQAKTIATNMSLFERKRAGWDPMAGPTLQIEEIKPENTDKKEAASDEFDALKEAEKEQAKAGNKDGTKETVKEPAKPTSKEAAPKKKGPGRPPKNTK